MHILKTTGGLILAILSLLAFGCSGADDGVMTGDESLAIDTYALDHHPGGHDGGHEVLIKWKCTARNRRGGLGFGESFELSSAMDYAVSDCSRWSHDPDVGPDDEWRGDPGYTCFITGCRFYRYRP